MELTHGVRCIKGETHSLITLMRLNTRWATRSVAATSYSKKSAFVSYYDDEDPLIASFRHLNEYLEGIYDLHDVDCVRYVTPFHHIITSEQGSGPLTSAALGSLSKFALYGFFSCHFPRVKDAMLLVADSISRCVFEETDWESDELILMKLLELSTLSFRCNAANLLSIDAAWDIYCTCISIYNHYRASKILKNEAETALLHLTLNVFTRASDMVKQIHNTSETSKDDFDSFDSKAIKSIHDYSEFRNDVINLPIDTTKGSRSHVQFTLSQPTGIAILMLKIIKVLSEMLNTSKSKNNDSVKFGLQLINVALEAGDTSLSTIAPLVDVLRNDICRHLLRATQSEDLNVFSLSLRVVFNLFMSIKDHMKVQLEVFLTSVHLRLLDQSSNISSTSAAVAASAARDELILESLLEFCREPALMQDLYTNYDCDVQCTNLFDAIINTLCRRSTLEIPKVDRDWNQLAISSAKLSTPSVALLGNSISSDKNKQVRLTILHKLAFDGLLAVVHSMAGKLHIHDKQSLDSQGCLANHDEEYDLSTERDHGKNEILLEKEIDKWCEVQVDRESLTQEDFEVYSLVTNNAPYSPINLNKRNDSQFFPADSTLSSPLQSSSISSSPLVFRAGSRQRRHSESSCSSINSGNIVDRENECTSNQESRAKSTELLRQRKLMKQKLKTISEQFNDKPLKQEWMKIAVDSGLIAIQENSEAENLQDKVDAKSVALFLKTIPGLGRPQIGEFISKGPAELYPFHAKVLAEYVRTFDFSVVNGSFDKALRLFLSSFRLPGEAQCIDRIMEAFAGRLFEQLDPGKPFANADAVFILSFSTIMLNTDLHNPHIAANKKMTKEEFIRNNRGINDRQDLPRDYLENIYDGIKANQIQVDFDSVDTKTNIDFTDTETWNKLMNRVSLDQAPANFTPTMMARRPERGWSSYNFLTYEVDMFLVVAKPAFETILVLWQHASDDLLLRRIVIGVFDYLRACSNLKLSGALSSAICVFLWSIGKYSTNKREPSRNKFYGRSFLMSNRHSYQQWTKESGHDLRRLLTVPIDDLVDEASGLHKNDAFDPLDWSEASLIKSEILLRVVMRSACDTTLNFNKVTWSTLFELLLWARSRGSLPQELSTISNAFTHHPSSTSSVSGDSSWKRSTVQSNTYRPSSFARNCFTEAFGFSSDSSRSTSDYHISAETSSKANHGNSWISYLWSSGGDEMDLSGSSSIQTPLSAYIIESALANDSFELFSNANASVHFDNKGHHLRTDDHFLQLTLEKCGLYQLFQTLLYENSKRGENLMAGLLLILSRVLGKLVGQAFDSIQWEDDVESQLLEGTIPLADIFPIYLLNDENSEFYIQPTELDAVILLEWLGKFTFLSEKSWIKFSGKLKEILHVFLSDEADNVSKKVPYFFERAINLLIRCILHTSNDGTLTELRHRSAGAGGIPIISGKGNSTFWGMLRILNDLHVELLSNLSGMIGSGLLTLLKALHHDESELSVDDWCFLVGLLSNVWNGWEGRRRVWESLSYLINEELIFEINFIPCRDLVLKYLDKSVFVGGTIKNMSAKESKEYRSNVQEWASNAMLYLLRLTLMALGGYINGQHEKSKSEDGSRWKIHGTSINASFKGRLRTQPREIFAFPDASELKVQLFSPSKLNTLPSSLQHNEPLDHVTNRKTSNEICTREEDENISVPHSLHRHKGTLDKKNIQYSEQPSWLEVPCIKFSRMEESELIWVASISTLADMCNIPSLPIIHRAIYCLEVLISSGNVANLPRTIWYKALDELISRLPLNLVSTSSKLQPGLAPTEIHDICFKCCNLIFHLIVMHIRELRKGEHFTAMFIRSVSAMTANAGVSAKGYTTHTEMISMIVALLRLLRLPELQQQSMEIKSMEVRSQEDKSEVVEPQDNTSPTGFLGVLHWMISPAQPSTKPVTIPDHETSNLTQARPSPTGHLSVNNSHDGPIRVVTVDHDGTLFLLTWKAIAALYAQLPAIINSWDTQYYKSIVQSIELIEAIKTRGETDLIASSSNGSIVSNDFSADAETLSHLTVTRANNTDFVVDTTHSPLSYASIPRPPDNQLIRSTHTKQDIEQTLLVRDIPLSSLHERNGGARSFPIRQVQEPSKQGTSKKGGTDQAQQNAALSLSPLSPIQFV